MQTKATLNCKAMLVVLPSLRIQWSLLISSPAWMENPAIYPTQISGKVYKPQSMITKPSLWPHPNAQNSLSLTQSRSPATQSEAPTDQGVQPVVTTDQRQLQSPARYSLRNEAQKVVLPDCELHQWPYLNSDNRQQPYPLKTPAASPTSPQTVPSGQLKTTSWAD